MSSRGPSGWSVLAVVTLATLAACKDKSAPPQAIPASVDAGVPLATATKEQSPPPTTQPAPLDARSPEARVVAAWSAAHSADHVEELTQLYAGNVKYYGTMKRRDEAVAAKKEFLHGHPDFRQVVSNLTVASRDGDRVTVAFAKAVTQNGATKMYPSYLVLVGSEIVAESDEVTDGNLRGAPTQAAPAAGSARTYQCGALRCLANEVCCGERSCVAIGGNGFCDEPAPGQRFCDPKTNEPCVAPSRCGLAPHPMSSRNSVPMCVGP